MSKKILIFGNGQIGNFYINYFTGKGIDAKIATGTDIRQASQVAQAIDGYKPSAVINVAARTNLEWCGEHRLEAFDINVLGAATIAKACDEKGIYMVHFSSGCIFSSIDGKDAKTETD